MIPARKGPATHTQTEAHRGGRHVWQGVAAERAQARDFLAFLPSAAHLR